MKYQDSAEAAEADDAPVYPAGDPSLLADANINPVTGLASDYLNHFIEAIMLLEMMTSAPEFRDEFLHWQPVGYREHFAGSRFKTRDVAIAAYERADPRARAQLDILSSTMTLVLQATGAALRDDPTPAVARRIARETVAHVKPMVTRAGAVINGHADPGDTESAQTAVDDLLMKA